MSLLHLYRAILSLQRPSDRAMQKTVLPLINSQSLLLPDLHLLHRHLSLL